MKGKTSIKNPFKPFAVLVPRKPLGITVPYVPCAARSKLFRAAIKEMTGAEPSEVNLTETPKKQMIKKDNVVGTTPGESQLVCSPTKHLTVTIISPHGKHTSKEELYLLVRQQDHEESTPSPVLDEISKALFSPEENLLSTATLKTRQSQPKRKTEKRERDVVGNSAANIVMKYLEKSGATFPQDDVIAEKWELCHLLSYAIAKNGKDKNGKPFDTQVAKNLFSGTRVLNENMMRIENVLLDLLNKNEIRSIAYSAEPFVLQDAHILAKLKLTVCITTHEGSQIKFDMNYNALTESRKLPHEASTCYSAFFKSLIHDKKPPAPGVNLKGGLVL